MLKEGIDFKQLTSEYNVSKETIRVGLKKSKSYQVYDASIEKEIYYNSAEERDEIVAVLYATLRKDISKQMKIDGNGGK